MATVYIPQRFKPLIERLGSTETKFGGRVFPTYMHLFIFASTVGFHHGRKEIIEPKDRGTEIRDDTFTSAKLDGIVYLLALHEIKDADILRETQDTECWKIIESYAAGGLDIIESWLIDSPSDIDGVDTIISKIKERASSYAATEQEDIRPEIEF